MTKVATSSRDDGVQDTWAYPDESGFLSKVESDIDRDGVSTSAKHSRRVPAPPTAACSSWSSSTWTRPVSASTRLYYKPDGSFDRSDYKRP